MRAANLLQYFCAACGALLLAGAGKALYPSGL
jgi:hypothetical protein